jgi:hypothetical protein
LKNFRSQLVIAGSILAVLTADPNGFLCQITNIALAIEMLILAAWPTMSGVGRLTALVYFSSLALAWFLGGIAHRRAGRDVDGLWIVIEIAGIAASAATLIGHTAVFAPATAIVWDLAAIGAAFLITAVRHWRDRRLRWSMVLWTLLLAFMPLATLACVAVVLLAGGPALPVLYNEAICFFSVIAFVGYVTRGPAIGFLDRNTIGHLIAMAGAPFLVVAFSRWP